LSAWKHLERRVCRDLGIRRRGQVDADGWAKGSDNTDGPISLECKYTTRYQLRRTWVEQARRQSKRDGRPWALVIAEHNDRRKLAVLDYDTFLILYRAAFAPLDDAPRGSTTPATPTPPSTSSNRSSW
jgi:hypothetical protein